MSNVPKLLNVEGSKRSGEAKKDEGSLCLACLPLNGKRLVTEPSEQISHGVYGTLGLLGPCP